MYRREEDDSGRSAFKILTGNPTRRTVICQSVAEVQLTDVAPLGGVSHRFNSLNLKPTGKRLLGRPRGRWEDNIRMDLKEINNNRRNLVDLAQYRDY